MRECSMYVCVPFIIGESDRVLTAVAEKCSVSVRVLSRDHTGQSDHNALQLQSIQGESVREREGKTEEMVPDGPRGSRVDFH